MTDNETSDGIIESDGGIIKPDPDANEEGSPLTSEDIKELWDERSAEGEDISRPYAEQTPLTWVFGNHMKTKLVASLLSEGRRMDVSKSGLADLTGVSRNTVYNHLPDLVDRKIVLETRTVGNSDMYALNWQHKAVPIARKLEERLLAAWEEGAIVRPENYTEDESPITAVDHREVTFQHTERNIEIPDDPYAENTPLAWMFGDHPKVKMLAALFSEPQGLILSDLARISGVERSTIYNHFNDLKATGLVKKTQKVGNSTLYKLEKNELTKLVYHLEEALLDERRKQDGCS